MLKDFIMGKITFSSL
jgi:hypothetical protein